MPPNATPSSPFLRLEAPCTCLLPAIMLTATSVPTAAGDQRSLRRSRLHLAQSRLLRAHGEGLYKDHASEPPPGLGLHQLIYCDDQSPSSSLAPILSLPSFPPSHHHTITPLCASSCSAGTLSLLLRRPRCCGHHGCAKICLLRAEPYAPCVTLRRLDAFACSRITSSVGRPCAKGSVESSAPIVIHPSSGILFFLAICEFRHSFVLSFIPQPAN